MKRLASFILAFVFLGSNLGFAVGTHFCGGHAVESEVMLGHKDLGCGMMAEAPAFADHHDLHHIQSIPCCKNEFQSLQLDDDLQFSITKVLVEPIASLTPLFVVTEFSSTSCTLTPFAAYSPPVPIKEVNIILQVFRI